jgi:hypothetical protein
VTIKISSTDYFDKKAIFTVRRRKRLGKGKSCWGRAELEPRRGSTLVVQWQVNFGKRLPRISQRSRRWETILATLFNTGWRILLFVGRFGCIAETGLPG